MDLSGLNDMQREAVCHTDGPLLIIAGAGSGKTKALTHRIAYLIEEKNVSPYNILAITFTNKAANEMKERVEAITPEGSGVWVSTFHSMCVRILRRFADRIGYDTNFTIYDSDDSKALMKEIFKRENVSTQYYKERNILSGISNAKNMMKSPKELMDEAGASPKAKKTAELYEIYQKELKKNNAMDFDDLIFMTVKLFNEDREVLNTFAQRFKYILVDEYQDTNTPQFLLVEKLASHWKNLCVVGDDDQSIYKFRGANIENILNFEKSFPGTKVIKFEQNYRSTSLILDAANAVIGNNKNRRDKKLWTANGEGEKSTLLMYDNAYDEASGIADKISQIHNNQGAGYNNFAILYRTNAQSRLLEEKLIFKNIPYKMYGGVNFYQRREIKDILAYLKVLANEYDSQAVKRIINVPKRGIGQTTLDRIDVFASMNDITFWEACVRVNEIATINGGGQAKIKKFVDMMQGFKEDLLSLSIEDLVCKMLEEIKYYEMLEDGFTTEELEERNANIDELINKIVDFESDETNETGKDLKSFLEEVSLVTDTGGDDDEEHVTLMTMHAVKGLEFDIVFMAGMEDGLFPSYMSIGIDGSGDELEEERRLCYVGITRAGKKLFLTYARERMVRGERNINSISRFVKEIPDAYLDKENMSLVGDSFGQGKSYGGGSSYGGGADYGGSAGSGKASFAQGSSSDSETAGQTGKKGFRPKNNAKFDFRKRGMAAGAAYASVKTGASCASPRPEVAGKDIHAFTKSKEPVFKVGDKVSNERFGDGVVTAVDDMGRDFLLTVDFENEGTKKMLAGFIVLKKL